MQSFGEILKKRREERNLDLNQISNDTNISVKFLRDLEEEHTVNFPGEVYLYGFLRSYSEYLELDTEKIISIYKAQMKQELPTPTELIHGPTKKKSPLFFVTLSVIFVGIAVGGILFYNSHKKARIEKMRLIQRQRQPVSYNYDGRIMENLRLYKGDTLNVVLSGGKIALTVGDTLEKFSLLTPQGRQTVSLGENLDIDVDNDMRADLTILVNDVSFRDPNAGVEVTVLPPVEKSITTDEALFNGVTSVAKNEEDNREPQQSGLSAENHSVIFEGNNAYPITLSISFRGDCLFYYSADNKPRVEKYYDSGETLVLQANNGFRLWMINANLVNIQVIGAGRSQNLEVGQQGQVLVEDIKWIRNDGKFRLMVLPVD
ncbi:MAG: helix-turn-helix domain-containing protein [Spirochaetaceae bacterium]|nr:helix-turn-helix domain-containing protein [Spirochaetaceae bacterium]